MKKVLGIAAAIVALHVLAAVGFAVWFAVARMNDQYAAALGKMLAGEPLTDGQPDQAASRPASAPADAPGDLAEREVVGDLEADMAAAQLAALKQSIESESARLSALRGQVEAEQRAWAGQKQAAIDARRSEGFRRVLTLYEEMRPSEVKEVWVGLPQEVLVALVGQMDASTVAGIFKEFRDPADLELKRKVLERIRNGEQGDPAGAAQLAGGN
jgi:flagellar motility protein MotE (MotC chaperone)